MVKLISGILWLVGAALYLFVLAGCIGILVWGANYLLSCF